MTPLPLTLSIDGPRVVLRSPRVSDAAALASLRQRSSEHLRPWSPVISPADHDPVSVRSRVLAERRAWRRDEGYGFCIVERATGAMLGRMNLNNVVRGVFQNAYVGYWVGAEYAGKGYATEALRTVLDAAFGPIALHRVQAAIIPRNERSMAVVRKAGMRLEGRAERYLWINGAWEDHWIYALTAEEWGR